MLFAVTLKVGRHPIGLTKLTWNVEKFIKANVARKKSEISKAIISSSANVVKERFSSNLFFSNS